MHSEWRILLVEDDPDGQAVVAHVLDYLQIAADVASNAEEAEAYLFGSENAYNSVIIDLSLPGKDGWELLSAILHDPVTAEIPCIAITAYHTSILREEAIQAGFNAYFAKPLDTNAFMRELEALLR